MSVLVTGAAGFIGMHTIVELLRRGKDVIGIDNFNSYYPVQLKRARLATLRARPEADRLQFQIADICDAAALRSVFGSARIDRVIHMAAQTGVRYSLDNPQAYIESNLVGFFNVLDASRIAGVDHFVYASSSSVYGENQQGPFTEHLASDRPASLYAATKRSNELMARCYSTLHAMPTSGLRFFTAYGPWGRPDMAYYRFTEAILQGRPIDVFNGGAMMRDFTYISDIVAGVIDVLDRPPAAPEASRVLNIGHQDPVSLLHFIEVIEQAIGMKATMNLLPMQRGDVTHTCADVAALNALTGYRPRVALPEGIKAFVDWYREYHQIDSLRDLGDTAAA